MKAKMSLELRGLAEVLPSNDETQAFKDDLRRIVVDVTSYLD